MFDSETSDSEKSGAEQEAEIFAKKKKTPSTTSADCNDGPRTTSPFLVQADVIMQQFYVVVTVCLIIYVHFLVAKDLITEMSNGSSNQLALPKYRTVSILNETTHAEQEIHEEEIVTNKLLKTKPADEEIISDDQKRKSWLTIENTTILSLLHYLEEKGFILTDLLIDYFNRHSKDFRIVSHILSKEKLILKKDYGNTQTPGLKGVIDKLSKRIQNSRSDDQHPKQNQDQHHTKPSLYERIEYDETKKIIKDSSDEIEADFNKRSRVDKILSAVFYLMLSQSLRIF